MSGIMPLVEFWMARIGEGVAAMNEEDPRWEWLEVTRLGDRERRYMRGRCRHIDVVPVESGGVVVAHLCLTCDAQLHEEWQP